MRAILQKNFAAAQELIARENPSLNSSEVRELWLAKMKEKKLKRKLAREGGVGVTVPVSDDGDGEWFFFLWKRF